MSILTMVMGIYAGFISSFKRNWLRILITSLLTLAFTAYIWMLCYFKNESYPVLCGIMVSIFAFIFILLCILIFKPKDIVGRRKLGKIIMDLTEDADVKSPICIFGGDLDFFGNVKKQVQTDKRWSHNILHFFTQDYNSNIETNKQMQQIIKMGFNQVQILCSKPKLKKDKYVDMRLRYGYIAKKLGEQVKFKFIQDDDSISDLSICKCTNCTYKNKCKRPGGKCSRLEGLARKLTHNPDTKLRGRIIEHPDTNAKDIILTTTIKRKKKYRIREYGLANKKDKDKLDWKLYEKIWNVWWERCSEDENLIQQCIEEYEKLINELPKK